MDLTNLSKDELQKAFIQVNAEYIEMIDGKPSTYISSGKKFLEIREHLHNVLNELQRRREMH